MPEISRHKQAEAFKKDFDTKDRNHINDMLSYGFYDYCYDGEEI